MGDLRRMMHDQAQPYGRRFGRTLDPLDYREGFPANGVELVGGFGLDEPSALDSKRAELAAASAKARAIAAAKAKSTAKQKTAPFVPPEASPPAKASDPHKLFSLEGAKAALPYVAVTVVLVVVISHFAMKGG